MAPIRCLMLGVSVLVISILAGSAVGERTIDKMYESIEGAAACYRRLNATHQFGCSSRRGGNVGVLAAVDTDADLDWLLGDAPAAPYMVMLSIKMFTRGVLLALRDSGRVAGVLVSGRLGADAPSFSADAPCPNGEEPRGVASCEPTHPWNPAGTDLLHTDLGFPMFTLDSPDTLNTIRQCYEKYNAANPNEQRGRSLCAIEMNAFMLAAVDSRTCIRRSNLINNLNPVKHCDPLGDRNVWSTLFPVSSRSSRQPLLMLAARLDATSMFDGLAPGGGACAPGIAMLLATATLLSQMLPPDSQDTAKGNVMFALFHGEAHSLIGSSRAAYDMSRGEFALGIELNDLIGLVELGQVAGGDPSLMFAHRSAKTSTAMSALLVALAKESSTLGVRLSNSTGPAGFFPGGPVASFTHRRPDLPGLVLASHDSQFNNRFYHSQWDDANNTGWLPGATGAGSLQAALAYRSLALARALFTSLTGLKYTGKLEEGNVTLVDQVLSCLLHSTNCSLFRAATPPGAWLPDAAPSHYVGVGSSGNLATALIGQALALLTGRTNQHSEAECRSDAAQEANDTAVQLLWMSGWTEGGGANQSGVCVESTMHFSVAVSPAFVIEDYDWLSGEFSTWTESVWREFSVRMFLVPAPAHEWLTLCVGVAVFLAASLAIGFLSAKADVLFADHTVLAAAC